MVGPTAIFDEVSPALAGKEPLARFAADDAAVTDAYIFALSGNTDVLSYVMVGALLGAAGQPIDMATVCIMGIALGIADDDTRSCSHY